MEFKAPSGAKFVINPADFSAAMELKSAVMREISKSDVKVELSALKNQKDLTDIVKLMATLDSSQAVENAVFKCLIRCTHNGEKITRDTFENVAAREDYYDIVFNCMKVNLSPFAKSLRLWLSTIMQAVSVEKDEGQKSE